jgi:hypothetical protein
MVKKLPQVKKGLKDFILNEDAQVIDRTATKIAITATFIGVNFMLNAEDANAKGHSDHSNHQNNLNAEYNYETGIHGGTNPMGVEVNNISDKSVETMHNNHYNHQDKDGGQMGMMIMLAVVAIACIALGPQMGAIGYGLGVGTMVSTYSATGVLVSTAFINGAIAAGIGTVVAGSAVVGGVAGAIVDSGGDSGGGDINTGNPHFVPEPILEALQEEEEN